jgi:hypothetical protein
VTRRTWMLLVPEILVVALALGAWLVARPPVLAWLDPRHNTNARYYLSHTSSQHDYRRIGSRVEGTCRCNLTYYYVGPASVDPAHVFTGPGLTLAPWPPGSVGVTRPWDSLLHGTGNTPQTGYCNITVDRYQHSYPPLSDWRLSSRERADFQAGKLDVLALYVGCARDGV